MEDSKIIELFFARNEDAIKQTDDTYGRRLYHLADNIVHNGQDAEESVSDTYLKVWETIPPHRPKYYFAYIAKICRHFALDKLDWKNAAKRNAEVVSLTQEMELCIPDMQRDQELAGKDRCLRCKGSFLQGERSEVHQHARYPDLLQEAQSLWLS